MVVRTAVIGAGTVSRTHLAGVKKNPRTELVAVCDVDESAANAMAREFGTRAVTDLSSLLSGDVDAIHICTPVQTHLEIATEAIEAGVAVLIEKPATVTVEEIEEIDALATEHDVPVSVVHNHLFDPAMRSARRLIDAGELGRITGVDVIYAGLTPPNQENRGSWVFDLPGGEFEEGLPHPIYGGLGLAGFPRSEDDVSAMTALSREYEEPFSYDQAQVQWVSDRGTLCSVKMLSDTKPNRLHIVNGSEGGVVVDEINQSLYRIDEDYTASTLARSKKALDVSLAQLASSAKNAKMVVQSQVDDSWENEVAMQSHYVVFDQFAKAVASGRPVPVPLEQAKWSVRILETIRESALPHVRAEESVAASQ